MVNARHIKNIPGHKTDKKDSKRIAKLLLAGLLKGSFIPTRSVCEMRDLTRYKRRILNAIEFYLNNLGRNYQEFVYYNLQAHEEIQVIYARPLNFGAMIWIWLYL